jgi:hypothetical protein
MSHLLDAQGYEQTKVKLADLERRQTEIAARDDLAPLHREQVLHSYCQMIRQYRRELKLHEAMQAATIRGA